MDDKMGPEDNREDRTMADIVNKAMDDQNKKEGNSKVLLNSKETDNDKDATDGSIDEKEDENEKGDRDEKDKEGKTDELACVDVGELRLMIQKSPSVIQCEQEELSKREAVLLICIFISLTVACTVLIIIVGAFRDKKECLGKFANLTKIMKRLTEEPQYCNSKSCMQVSATMLQSRGSYDPCLDFYSYTCSDWRRLHPHADADWSTEDELRMRIRVRVVEALGSSKEEKSLSVRKAKELYSSCMNTDTLDNGGSGALTEAVDSIGGWNYKSGWVQKSIEDQLISLHTKYGVKALFSVKVVPDPQKDDSYIIELGKGDLTFPKTKDYSDANKQKAFTTYATKMATLMGVSESNGRQFAENVLRFEEGIAKVQDQSYTTASTVGRIPISDLQLASPEISWLKYLKTSGFDVTSDSAVLVSNKNYLKAISAILKAANRTTFNNYVVWRLAHALALDLDRNYRLAALAFEMDFSGRVQPRWQHCFDDVLRFYKMAVGNLYSRDVHHKSVLTHLVNNVNAQLRGRVETNFTMDDQMKVDVLKKLGSVHVEYVAPLLEKEVDMMDGIYNSYMHFNQQDTYQQKMAKLFKADSKRQADIYSDPQIITNEWPIASIDVKPYYCRHKNKLYIPAGSMDVPIYHNDLPTYYNYATMGTKIVTQLMKALDPNGLNDDDLAVPQWMDRDGDDYAATYGCMTEYLASRRQTDNFTTGDMLAEVTALGLAFDAYVEADGRTEIPIAASGQSIDQTFFTSYVLAQCSSDMTKGARPTMSVLHQSAFADAFHCKEIENQCSMWIG